MECKKALAKAKTLLPKAPVFMHYDLDQPIVLTTDASAYGLGMMLFHQNPERSEITKHI